MKKSLLILMVCLPVFLYAQTTTTFSFAGNQTFVAPAGVTSITVQAWGAGGAGGGTTDPGFNATRGGAGGGGGAFASATFNITLGQTMQVVVGKGGAGSVGNGTNGGFSRITEYAAQISAAGGLGGTRNNAGGSPLGGVGGTVAASVGTIRLAGSNGVNGATGIGISSGAGGNAANGGGAGGVGNDDIFVSIDGVAGIAPGGGGGGSRSVAFGGNQIGGAGGDGKVIISYDCPNPSYSLTSTTASAVNVCSGTSSEITLTGNLPIGLYAVSYEIQGVAQTPASMNVTTAGTGSFIASGFTAVGTKFVKITGLSSGSSATASENCNSVITTFNTASVIVNSSGTAPVATAVTAATCTQITANWQVVSGAVYYEFDLSTDPAFGSFVAGYSALNVGNVASLTITGLTNTTYYYRVRAFNGTCSSANSNTITHANPTTPGTPVTSTNSGATCSQITANWAAVTGAATYFIDVSTSNTSNATFEANRLVAYNNLNVGNVITKDITGLAINTTYYYRVRASNNCGTGPNSTVRTITTLSVGAGTPEIPVGLAATNRTCSQFTANWGSSNRASSYSIEVSTSNNNMTAFNNNRLPAYTNLNVGNVTSFDVVGLAASTNYYYRVKAINNCGTSGASGIFSTSTTSGGAGTPPIPLATAGSGQNCSQITANWNAATLATTYFIDVSTSGTAFNANILPAYNNLNVGNVLTKNITGLAVNTNYYYRVRAMNNCGTSVSSNVITYNTIPIPGTPTITATPAGASPLSICQTDGVKLTSSAASGNVWSTGEITQDIFVTSAGTFTVKVDNGGGCSSNTSIPFTVNIDGLPTAVAGSLQTICSNQSTTVLGASASNGTINWTVSGGGALNNYSIINPVYTPSLGGPARTVVLTLTVTSSNSCTPQIATAKHAINIQGAPTVLVSGSQEICSSGSATVGAGEATAAEGTLLWTHDGTGSLTNATTLTPTYIAAPGDAGKQVDLTLTVTASPTCSTPYRVRGVYPVFVLANNTVTAASSSPILCINTLMNTITHTTTIASGIGTPVNLPAGVSASWASNTITLSGTPIEAGTFAYSIPLTGGCGSAINAIGTIVVNLNEAGAASSIPTLCNLTAMTAITHTTTGATGIGTPTNLPPGITAGWASNLITISGTPTSTGTFNYTIPMTGGCGNASATGTITVNPLPVTPMLGTIIQPTCVTPTGNVELTGLLSGSALQIIQDGPAPRTIPITISGSTYEISSLAPGIYTFAIQDGVNCPSLPTVTVEIKVPVTNIWSADAWSEGSTPLNTDSIEFAQDYESEGNLEGCSCKVNAGKHVTIKSGHTLEIENGVVVESGANATLTFENNASLVQKNNVPNTGNIIYKRNSVPIRQADYVYWSSPVSGQTLAGVSPLTKADKYYSYDGTKWINVSRNTVMTVGKGYIIRGPDNFSNTVRGAFSASFTGIPNNGDIDGETVILNRFYLIGNPYPSALDADEFISENDVLEGTLYFWTHNTPVVLGGAYEYASDDYASYNLSGGVGTAAALSGDDDVDNNDEIPSGKIGAGQSFFAEVTTSGTIVFNNLMREGGSANSQFFKPGKNTKTTALEKHRLWLNMTNDRGAFKQTMIGYIEGATNGKDKRFDGASFDGNQYLDFYSINDGTNLVIQGRALPFADTDLVPLGYRTTISGEFTISIQQVDGNLTNQAVYLEDKKTGVIYDLRSGNYKFMTETGTFADRFVLRYTNKTLGTVDVKQIEQAILVSVKDKIIKVASTKENISGISIFDVTGKLLYSKNKIGVTEFVISNLQSGNQVLLIKTTLENAHINTTKIIF